MNEIRYVAGYSAADVAERIHRALARSMISATTHRRAYMAKDEIENDLQRVYRVTIEDGGMSADDIDMDTGSYDRSPFVNRKVKQ